MTDKDYDDTNRGVLFKVTDKKKEKSPDYNGSINIEGTERWLSGWINTSKAGNKYLSLSLGDEKEAQGEKPAKKDEDPPFD